MKVLSEIFLSLLHLCPHWKIWLTDCSSSESRRESTVEARNLAEEHVSAKLQSFTETGEDSTQPLNRFLFQI